MPNLVVTKNYQDDDILDSSMLDAALDSISTFTNSTKLDSTNIQTGGVAESNIATGAVTASKLGASAVATAKLADGAVTTPKIADGSVTRAKTDSTLQQSFCPTGAILPYAASSAPSGWLLCDGSAISRTTYATLFAAIGTSFGNGDGSTTFNVPDTRGYFLRGVDGSAGRDADAASRTALNGGATGNNIGSVQDSQNKQHNHTASVSDPGHSHSFTKPVTFSTGSASGGATAGDGQSQSTASATTGISVSIGNDGGSESRPKNLYVQYIIKT